MMKQLQTIIFRQLKITVFFLINKIVEFIYLSFLLTLLSYFFPIDGFPIMNNIIIQTVPAMMIALMYMVVFFYIYFSYFVYSIILQVSGANKMYIPAANFCGFFVHGALFAFALGTNPFSLWLWSAWLIALILSYIVPFILNKLLINSLFETT